MSASAPGYVTSKAPVKVECKPEEHCEHTVTFSLLPEDSSDKVDIVLNWGANAVNLDLHSMQINKDNPGAGCETFFNKVLLSVVHLSMIVSLQTTETSIGTARTRPTTTRWLATTRRRWTCCWRSLRRFAKNGCFGFGIFGTPVQGISIIII